ncbi:MazG-like family protein [Gracilibacillus orientalis]|uniref:MazG-like family protein n=1 Tax=Gracilibacillus orientalis TaxID=334253 RepID=UPI000B8291A9
MSYNSVNIKEELADTLIYSILLADELNLNIEEIILEKLDKKRNTLFKGHMVRLKNIQIYKLNSVFLYCMLLNYHNLSFYLY